MAVTSRARSRGRDVTGIAISEQLISAGASPVQVRRLARQGRLLMVRRGVYAPADLAAAAVEDHVKRHAMRLAAVAAKSGYRTVGSHQTAAVLHDLDLIGRPSASLVTVTRSPRDQGSRASRMGVRVHSAELPRGHVVTSGSSAGRTTSGRGTGRSRKPTAPSSTRIRGRRCANSAGMRGYAMRASK